VLRAREHAPTPSPFVVSKVVFTFGLLVESLKELGGALSMGFKMTKGDEIGTPE
jgi:hypothetical protein